ncbi:zf-HC2 domain-containing protein [Paraburkholderia terricola]|uniref:Putative zinc-finger domain-containing protein n=2 Tax=Burkholderiaceae TaxID=119060 RepID=A0ABU1LUY8_9BURK|nr:zf-HC2 domain-containing protein [Paraburkholderia terricola]MDR6410325.1 hypothetical protein [Paraburkholderia terricola]MDR6481485.1 hypothetical protein [Paraburkholderia terricola]
MNPPVDRDAVHRHAWESIPWVLNGSASEHQRRAVEAHLRECARCRAEWEFQRKVYIAMSTEEQSTDAAADSAAERGLAHFWQRFDDAGQHSPAPSAKLTGWASRGRLAVLSYGLAAAVLLQAGALAVLGGQWFSRPPPAQYRTLSQAEDASAAPTVRLVVDPAMPIGRLQSVLAQLQLQIVAGPSEAGVYSLASMQTSADTSKQIAVLRATPGVRFAEPVGRAAATP